MNRKSISERIERLKRRLPSNDKYGIPPMITVQVLQDGSISEEDQAEIDRLMEERKDAPGIKLIVVMLPWGELEDVLEY